MVFSFFHNNPASRGAGTMGQGKANMGGEGKEIMGLNSLLNPKI
jgi:hypothetical protein